MPDIDTVTLKDTVLPSSPLIIEPEVKQKCMICNALLAKTFIDLNGKRIHLCQQDAFTMLRMACKLEPVAATNVLKFVNEQIYGNEEGL
jgi:hypothetical protein